MVKTKKLIGDQGMNFKNMVCIIIMINVLQ